MISSDDDVLVFKLATANHYGGRGRTRATTGANLHGKNIFDLWHKTRDFTKYPDNLK
jgi:hypothetical protein